ncbi:hypothetical protein L1987_19772 [Smallanthus sonchifolius]|uniref:Uncharacterized protein n=1 Tax=Smallanthus sonchifolius TaxID=185202 RepID=A0ACB9ISX7_9ASTR|nr:hypothetical protein L1987_19772 [Smallanthus sonchifolius]
MKHAQPTTKQGRFSFIHSFLQFYLQKVAVNREYVQYSVEILPLHTVAVLVYDWTFSISIHSTINANLTPVFPSTDANLSRFVCVKEIQSFSSLWTTSRT